jgi:hypothetical protein
VDDLLIYTGNICSFTTYKYHADVLEQDDEFMPLCYFPATIHIAG